MRDGVETGKKTGRRKISRQKNFTGQQFYRGKLYVETGQTSKKWVAVLQMTTHQGILPPG